MVIWQENSKMKYSREIMTRLHMQEDCRHMQDVQTIMQEKTFMTPAYTTKKVHAN